jgi:hypothetical protein
MPAHAHQEMFPIARQVGSGSTYVQAGEPGLGPDTLPTGGNQPHNNVQPTILLQAFICTQATSYYAKEMHRVTIHEETEDQATCCSSFFGRWLFGRWLTDKLPLLD